MDLASRHAASPGPPIEVEHHHAPWGFPTQHNRFPPNTTASPPGWYKGKADRHTPSESESCTTAQPFVSKRSPSSTSRWMEKFMAGGRHFCWRKKNLGGNAAQWEISPNIWPFFWERFTKFARRWWSFVVELWEKKTGLDACRSLASRQLPGHWFFCSKKHTSARSLLSRAARLLEKGGQSLHPDQQAKQSQAVVSGYRDLQMRVHTLPTNQTPPTPSTCAGGETCSTRFSGKNAWIRISTMGQFVLKLLVNLLENQGPDKGHSQIPKLHGIMPGPNPGKRLNGSWFCTTDLQYALGTLYAQQNWNKSCWAVNVACYTATFSNRGVSETSILILVVSNSRFCRCAILA